MTEPLRLSAEAIAAGVAAGELSALETLEIALSRIEAVEPRVGAFLALEAGSARAQARSVDERRRRGERLGRPRGSRSR
jgi:aspartyl-tRNA(Asn)/glutamyl-tRNA(Gln) amidotransferase subunit A